MSDRQDDFGTHLAAARSGTGPRAQLLEQFREYLRVLARPMIDSDLRVKLDASDLAQETLIRAHERFDQFRGTTERELAAWLRRMLARRLVDFARSYRGPTRHAGREHSLEGALDASSAALGRILPADVETPSVAAQQRETGVVLARALARLDPEQQEVIVLRSLRELEWDEVGQRMGRSAEAARQLWNRALAKLGPLLEQQR